MTSASTSASASTSNATPPSSEKGYYKPIASFKASLSPIRIEHLSLPEQSHLFDASRTSQNYTHTDPSYHVLKMHSAIVTAVSLMLFSVIQFLAPQPDATALGCGAITVAQIVPYLIWDYNTTVVNTRNISTPAVLPPIVINSSNSSLLPIIHAATNVVNITTPTSTSLSPPLPTPSPTPRIALTAISDSIWAHFRYAYISQEELIQPWACLSYYLEVISWYLVAGSFGMSILYAICRFRSEVSTVLVVCFSVAMAFTRGAYTAASVTLIPLTVFLLHKLLTWSLFAILLLYSVLRIGVVMLVKTYHRVFPSQAQVLPSKMTMSTDNWKEQALLVKSQPPPTMQEMSFPSPMRTIVLQRKTYPRYYVPAQGRSGPIIDPRPLDQRERDAIFAQNIVAKMNARRRKQALEQQSTPEQKPSGELNDSHNSLPVNKGKKRAALEGDALPPIDEQERGKGNRASPHNGTNSNKASRGKQSGSRDVSKPMKRKASRGFSQGRVSPKLQKTRHEYNVDQIVTEAFEELMEGVETYDVVVVLEMMQDIRATVTQHIPLPNQPLQSNQAIAHNAAQAVRAAWQTTRPAYSQVIIMVDAPATQQQGAQQQTTAVQQIVRNVWQRDVIMTDAPSTSASSSSTQMVPQSTAASTSRFAPPPPSSFPSSSSFSFSSTQTVPTQFTTASTSRFAPPPPLASSPFPASTQRQSALPQFSTASTSRFAPPQAAATGATQAPSSRTTVPRAVSGAQPQRQSLLSQTLMNQTLLNQSTNRKPGTSFSSLMAQASAGAPPAPRSTTQNLVRARAGNAPSVASPLSAAAPHVANGGSSNVPDVEGEDEFGSFDEAAQQHALGEA
ncbi:hypothetical protein GQ44DRAFT_828173 [Phaeosphaeriaceae sp. PMI808]|nr:hypothetical protein GQ44DRAFT_828173 [Phaeosphaeriaceae sp. PMI808]